MLRQVLSLSCLGLALASPIVTDVSAHVESRANAGWTSPPTQQDVVIKRDDIYHGNPDAWTRAAVIDGRQILKATPSFKEIVRQGLQKGDPRYDLLKAKAAKEFSEAIKKASDKVGYDLVGELGSVVIKGRAVPEITTLVMKEL
ncbi:MAG: hypothetical protein H6834_17400 [Planctomycetes bacterium]|nr:hypothetical protein [Planctomycetota bacterium]